MGDPTGSLSGARDRYMTPYPPELHPGWTVERVDERFRITHTLHPRPLPCCRRSLSPAGGGGGWNGPHHSICQFGFLPSRGRAKEDLIGRGFVSIVSVDNARLPMLDRVNRTGKSETHAGQETYDEYPPHWSYTVWPILGVDGRSLGIFIRVAEATLFQEDAVVMNQALLLSSVHQYDLRAEAENLNAQLKIEILATTEA